MTQDDFIGLQLDEYRLDSLLGRGGMARVYHGMDVNLNRPAAIKVIDLPHRSDSDYVMRFRREAQAVACLDHPHIVRLYRYGEVRLNEDGDILLYMAMQFIKGADLEYILKSYQTDGEFLETPDACRIIREICSALDYAHTQGVIHRDVKPSNIMLDSQGHAVLTDFGLALLSTQGTRGEIFGSPEYISPEQIQSSAKAVPQSDIYSMGVIMYEMFTGTLPFQAAKPLELAMMHLNDPVPAPRTIRPEISPKLEAVILKALEKQPEDRYPTGQALWEAVENAFPENLPLVPITRRSLPDRVQLGMDIQDLIPTMASIPDAVTPEPCLGGDIQHRLTGKFEIPRAPLFWILSGLGGLFLLMVCITGAALVFNNSAFTTRTPGSPTSSEQGGSSRIYAQAMAVVGIDHSPSPASTPTNEGSYSMQITRHGEDEGYFILQNTGNTNIPLPELNLSIEKGQLHGSAWGIDWLAPGTCVLAWKGKSSEDNLPRELQCDFAGEPVLIQKSQEGIFKENLGIWLGDLKIGTCAKDRLLCSYP